MYLVQLTKLQQFLLQQHKLKQSKKQKHQSENSDYQVRSARHERWYQFCLSPSEAELSPYPEKSGEYVNQDEADPGETMPDDSEIARTYYDSLTPDDLGSGWFNRNLETLPTMVTVSNGARFRTSPRVYDDKTAASIPADHPLRAIAKVLKDAPTGTVIRIYMFMLTDPFAIDMLIQLILHYDEEHKNKNTLEDFSRNTEPWRKGLSTNASNSSGS